MYCKNNIIINKKINIKIPYIKAFPNNLNKKYNAINTLIGETKTLGPKKNMKPIFSQSEFIKLKISPSSLLLLFNKQALFNNIFSCIKAVISFLILFFK